MDFFDIFGFATTAVIALLTIAAALAFLHDADPVKANIDEETGTSHSPR